MTRDAIQSLARHLLTGVGSYVVARGAMSESEASEAIGALSLLIGVAWSLWDKWSVARERDRARNLVPRTSTDHPNPPTTSHVS